MKHSIQKKLTTNFSIKIGTTRVDQVIDNTGAETLEGAQKLSSALYANHKAKDLPIVVKVGDKYEVIARPEEIAAARERGEETIEVLIWVIPKKLILAARLLKNGRNMKLQQALPILQDTMDYFNQKKKGDGAELRKVIDPDDKGLADFVADLFGINRTDLYKLLDIYVKKPHLLKFIDSGVLTVKQAIPVINKKKSDDSGDGSGSGEGKPKKNRLLRVDEVKSTQQLTRTEFKFITVTLPELLIWIKSLLGFPDDIQVERVYQHVSKKGKKTGDEPVPKVDHLGLAFKLDGKVVSIFIHEETNPDADSIALDIPRLTPDSDTEDLAIAA